jgi:plasmid stability protein
LQSASILGVKNIHVRGVPDAVHAALQERAGTRNVSLNSYVTELLSAHCRLPTLDEWLDGLDHLEPAADGGAATEVLAESREEDDREVVSAARRDR